MITNKDKMKFVDTILTLMGLVFLLVGIGLGIYYIFILQDGIELIGTIIATHGESKVLVGYEINGEYYQQYLYESSSSYYIGEELHLYYSIKTGLVYSSMTTYLLPIMFSIIGLGFFIPGIILFFIKRKNKKFLSEKHKYIKKVAKVVDIRINNMYSVGNQHPKQLICEVYFEGEKFKIKSPNIWDKVYYEKYHVVDVYFKNKKKYIVDAKSYRKDELYYEMEIF